MFIHVHIYIHILIFIYTYTFCIPPPNFSMCFAQLYSSNTKHIRTRIHPPTHTTTFPFSFSLSLSLTQAHTHTLKHTYTPPWRTHTSVVCVRMCVCVYMCLCVYITHKDTDLLGELVLYHSIE